MFQISIFVINLDIKIGFFNFFGLPFWIWLIKFLVQICFVPPYKIHSDIFYNSYQVLIIFLFGLVRTSGYGYYADA